MPVTALMKRLGLAFEHGRLLLFLLFVMHLQFKLLKASSRTLFRAAGCRKTPPFHGDLCGARAGSVKVWRFFLAVWRLCCCGRDKDVLRTKGSLCTAEALVRLVELSLIKMFKDRLSKYPLIHSSSATSASCLGGRGGYTWTGQGYKDVIDSTYSLKYN